MPARKRPEFRIGIATLLTVLSICGLVGTAVSFVIGRTYDVATTASSVATKSEVVEAIKTLKLAIEESARVQKTYTDEMVRQCKEESFAHSDNNFLKMSAEQKALGVKIDMMAEILRQMQYDLQERKRK